MRTLKASGIRVITIANFSPTMLRSNAESAGLLGFVDALVSTDANHTYKPDPRAKSFGCTTFWVNRFNQPFEELGIRPDQTTASLGDLLRFVLRTPSARAPQF